MPTASLIQFGQRAKIARAPSFLRIRNIRRNEPSDQDIPRVFKRICAGRQRNQPVARLGLNRTFEIGFRLRLFDKRALIVFIADRNIVAMILLCCDQRCVPCADGRALDALHTDGLAGSGSNRNCIWICHFGTGAAHSVEKPSQGGS